MGAVCYEMLIGRPVFDAEDMDDLISKVENGGYVVPTSVSREVISFLNGMLQYESDKRFTSEQLAKHDFLTKDVKDFDKIDVKKVSGKITGEGLNINVKKNKTIWSIFNSEDEDKLNKIGANEENEEVGRKDNDYSGPKLPNSKVIPGNPTNEKISSATPQDMSENGFATKGNLFD